MGRAEPREAMAVIVGVVVAARVAGKVAVATAEAIREVEEWGEEVLVFPEEGEGRVAEEAVVAKGVGEGLAGC